MNKIKKFKFKECHPTGCWFDILTFSILTFLANIAGTYYSFQVERFTRKVFRKNRMILENHEQVNLFYNLNFRK